MKRKLLTLAITSILTDISAARFRYFNFKPALLALMLAFGGVFFSNSAYATTTIASITAIGAQNGSVTYGTGSSVTYAITFTTSGTANGSESFSFNWIGAAPSGVTLSPSSGYNPKGLTSLILTVSTSTSTSAGSFNFTLTATHASGGSATSGVSGTLLIGKKALTITASNQSKNYGTTFSFTGNEFSQSGLAGSDAITSVTFASSGAAATAAVAGSPYSIVPSGAVGTGLSNYNISYVNGTMTVNKAPLTITANNQSKTYGTTFSFAGTEFTSSGLSNSDAVSGVTLTSSGSAATAQVSGSPYSIVPSAATGTGLANYNITYASGTMTLNKVTLTITGITGANDKTYDGTTSTTLTGTGTLNGVINGDAVGYTGAFASANVGTGITVNIALTGTGATNYTLTQPGGLTANITAIALTITATGPTKTYGTALTAGASSANFTATGTAAGESVTGLTLTPDAAGLAATTAAGATYVVTPSAPTGSSGFLASNYIITYVNYTGTVTTANLTVTATGPSLGFSAGFTNGSYSTYFTTSATAVAGEAVTSVTLTSNPAITATTPVGTAYTITPSAAVGSGGFLASNYNITYVDYSDAISKFVYTWTGAGGNSDWTTTANWTSSPSTGATYPGVNDDVAIGVTAYTGNQPTVSSNQSCSSLNFGTNGGNTIILTVNGSTTFTVGSDVTLNSGTTAKVSLVNNGTVSINGGYNNNTGTTLTVSGTGPLSIAGPYINNGTTTFGSGAVTMSGTFTNGGTTTFGTGLVTFNATGGPNVFSTGKTTANTVTFNNVLFTGGGFFLFKTNGTGAAGKFNVSSTGTLTVGDNTHVGFANITFTLLSDASGSASVAPIPSTAVVSGTVNVQRYMQAKRGYRLMASPVNGGSDANGNNVYSVNYLKNSTYLTGTTGTAGLFDKTGNPTLYLYREDIIADNTSFITGNYRGISDLSSGNANPPSYSINLDGSGFNIPVSNGYLFYYRGSRKQKTLAQLTTAGAAATTDTLTASGTLNTGQIIFKDWYTPSSTSLGYSNPDPTIIGFNLAGNPYASSIDWETYNTISSTSGIYAQNISDYVYELNGTTQNYDVYQVGGISTNNANRTIVSGQGFFVLATGPGATLTFNESAKNTTLQNTGLSLYMGRPVEMAANNQSLKLQMAMDSINTDDMVIVFNKDAKASFDLKEDAPYKVGSGKVSLASLSSDRKLLAINHMPLNHKMETIALKVNATSNGTYSLNMNSIQIPKQYDIWLMDAYKNDSLDMRQNKTYKFDVIKTDTATYGAYRFKLVIRKNPAFIYRLLNFNANKATGKQVQLAWLAEHEANYTNFTVERSTDGGTTYAIVGGVPSTGAGLYGLTDKTPGENNLYRLKQEDINNNITYSHIIPVGFANQSNALTSNNINIYPNPASSAISMNVNTAVNSNSATYHFTITNNYGLIIKQGTSAQANWQTDISDLMPGTYIIQVVNNKDKSFVGKSKLVKL